MKGTPYTYTETSVVYTSRILDYSLAHSLRLYLSPSQLSYSFSRSFSIIHSHTQTLYTYIYVYTSSSMTSHNTYYNRNKTTPAVGTTDDSPTPTAHPSVTAPERLYPNRYYYKYIYTIIQYIRLSPSSFCTFRIRNLSIHYILQL